MIEPTDEMRNAFYAESDEWCDVLGCVDCFDDRLAAVLALVERDYRLTRKPGTARPRRVASVSHDPQALRWARERAGWRQSHLARAIGVSSSLLCEAEKGTRSLTAAALARAAAVLNCPVAVLERKAGAS